MWKHSYKDFVKFGGIYRIEAYEAFMRQETIGSIFEIVEIIKDGEEIAEIKGKVLSGAWERGTILIMSLEDFQWFKPTTDIQLQIL